MANQNYNKLAKDILDHVGGEDNVKDVRHCITRLRFNLKDDKKADTNYIKRLDGVVTVVQSGGQYQVVIGEQVAEVYGSLMQISKLGNGGGQTEEVDVQDDRSFVTKFIDFISGIFQPFLMPLAATGMIKGVAALMTTFGVDPTSGLYLIVNFAGDAFFQFLPIMVALTAARKFKMSEFTALAITVALLHPGIGNLLGDTPLYTLFAGTPFESPVFSTFLGLPVILPPSGNYFSAIIPTILAVWAGAEIEKRMRVLIPSLVRSFLTPFFTVIIAVPLAYLVIGPVASWASDLIGVVFTALQAFSPLLFGAILGVAWQILVIFGLHWGIIPIMYVLLAEQGSNPISPVAMVSTFGVLGVVLALAFKSKEKRVRDIAIPGSISLLFGISEPTIYGLMLPLRRSFMYALIGNLVGGAYIGATNAAAYRTGGLGVFSVLNMIESDGSISMNVWNTVIGFAIAIIIGFVLQMVMPVPVLDEAVAAEPVKDDTQAVTEQEMLASANEEIIGSPVTGDTMPLNEVPDEVFSSEALGKGIAINPTVGEVVAPANGTVTALFETGHAIGITTDSGTELLIHIGLDTVEMNGKGFEALVTKGQTVSAGQTLIRFDIEAIKAAGYSPIIPIVVTNTNTFMDVLMAQEARIEKGDYLLTTLKLQERGI
ncbi:beta-glucoside-specific PTS transporter subunit IIABC [Jeotgalibaca sp. A127]|uniref:beta-glucoside-specific PTS transporter subunit IIABC n=1 Tax=Jeotgalibaca sp. A127 TaxID=3457324 RepID=UPI003FD38ADF